MVGAKLLKLEHWSRTHLATLTFYVAYAVRVTIFSTAGKIPPCFDYYVVTRSYSSRTRSYVLLYTDICWQMSIILHLHHAQTSSN